MKRMTRASCSIKLAPRRTHAWLLPYLFPAGLLVPDIPLEETPEVRKCCTKYGLELILLTTPTTSQVRGGGGGDGCRVARLWRMR